ncbi:family 1 glycosylhydrolase [Agromyces sp. ISL-38]|uniref:glycoside hydrolase family 1 protein n=1 Tax=Agromyces sp. ISL-38 TaxID=2819107 RepID=UPI001BEB31BA|nr:family 1 glycosylhydrolase [Agromyces sp. ISL-38]MBT2498602.1 family 1 glycosylhydrolase [Agromyces sp. ISL-38]
MTKLAGVRWGSATAAYQIEGAVTDGGRVPTIWDEFTARPGATTRGDTGAVACGAYDDPEGMLDAIEWLGLETYRFSIAWSRIITGPEGQSNPEGIAYYRRVLQELRDRGVTPVVTLYHWDLPQWLQDRGGWTSLATTDAFVHFANVAARELGDLVNDWITVNEPFCAAFHGHLSGLHAPGIQDEPTALRAALVQLHTHGEAARALRAINPDFRIGLAMNLSDLAPATEHPEDLEAHRRADLVENRLFLYTVLQGRLPADTAAYFGADAVSGAVEGIDVSRIAEPLDFIGINYYEHNVVCAADQGNDLVVRGIEKLPVPEPRSSNGVAVRPDGFTRVLLRVAALAPDLPIWVTENGIGLWDYLGPDGTCNDIERVAFIDQYLDALADAVTQGAKVEAYYFWALMDNFEWSHGYELRYGLFYTDYPSGRLTPKASAQQYRSLIAEERGGGADNARRVGAAA